MRVGVLGPLELHDDSGRPVPITGRRLRALLIRLAVDAGRFVAPDRLIHDLWQGTPPSTPGSALHSLISRLRAAGVRDLVESGAGGYRLAVDPGDVDAVRFERAVARARAEPRPEERAAELRLALGLWRGPAYAEVSDASFAIGPISRLEGLRQSAIEERIEADLALGGGELLVPELEMLSAEHPTRERLRGQLMRALYAAGRPSEALEVFEQTRHDLAERLGVDPSAELAVLHLAILRQDPALTPAGPGGPGGPGGNEPAPLGRPSALGRPAASNGRRSNLPAPLTSFVGREPESRQLETALCESRLVTLTGPGGAGKTRLAREVTGRLLNDFADGVWFVPLAPVASPLDVPQAVLVALGLSDSVRSNDVRAVVAPMDRLADVLADRTLILVLDNCEHLIDAIAQLADRILAESPGLRILATSREPLGITGETLCPVPSLPLPQPQASPAEAAGLASVQLFTDRAAAVHPGFVLDVESTPLVIGICRELDGIPLAIELAAARLRSLSLAQIAGRLDDRFRLLNGGSRTALPRHQTLRAVVDWSWDLLEKPERVVLRRLSVFAGGATLESAEQVCGLDGGAGDGEVIDVIASLIDKSLVITTGDGEVRYRLLETVRAYATERLTEADELETVRAAQAAYFADLAERAEPELRRRDQLTWLRRMIAERDNCSTALRWAIDARDVRTALRLIGALCWFWVMTDYEVEAGSWAVSVRELAGDRAPAGLEDQYAICLFAAVMVTQMSQDPGPTPKSIARILESLVEQVPESPGHPVLTLVRPMVAVMTGDLARAHERLQVLAGHPDPWVRAITRIARSFLLFNQAQLESAGVELHAAYDGFDQVGDRWGKVLTLRALIDQALILGDPPTAVRYAEEAHGYATAEFSPEAGSALMICLGTARARGGDLERGRAEITEGLRDAERIGERPDTAGGYLILAELARAEGDLAAARPLLESALALVESRALQAGFTEAAARTFSKLGCLTEQEGDLDAAAGWHARALEVVQDDAVINNQSLAGVIEGLAALAAARADHQQAAELLGRTYALHGYRDPYSLEVDRATESATAALGPAAFDAAYERGRRAPRAELARDLTAALSRADPTSV